jgi:hypothetical protein
MRTTTALACSLLLASCASTTYTLSPVSVGKQYVEMNRGVATIRSAWKDSTVIVTPVSADLEGNIALWVAVENTSNQSANLGTENVAVSFDGQNWKPAQPYEQLKGQVDNNAAWASFGAALLTGLSVAAASQAGQYHEHGMVATPYGTASYSINAVDRGQQLAAMNSAAAAGGQLQQSIDARHDADVAKLDAQVLRTTTVAPGSTYGGLVVADAPKLGRDSASTVLIRVSFLNDTHVMEFQAHQPGQPVIPAADVGAYPALTTEAVSNLAAVPPMNIAASAVGQHPDVIQAAPAASPAAFQSFENWEQTQPKKSGGQ